jgi:hypothetical protein
MPGREIIAVCSEIHVKHINVRRGQNVELLAVKTQGGSSVGIATDYGLEGPGSNPDGDEIFRPSRPALGPTQPPVQWVSGLCRE